MTTGETGEGLVRAVVQGDWKGIEARFQPLAQFRALVPGGLREASGGRGAAQYYEKWFSDADAIEVQRVAVEEVADRVRVSYRLRVHKDRWYAIQQEAFCTIRADRIEKMDLLCSGFRPEGEAPDREAPYRGVPDRARLQHPAP